MPDGERVKNQHIDQYLGKFKGLQYKKVDTENWKRRLAPLFFSILFHSFFCERIVLSVCSQSAFFLLWFFSIFGLQKKVCYFVIGGSLLTLIEEGKVNPRIYKKILRIFVETKRMKAGLAQLGLKNVEVVPNFKFFPKQDPWVPKKPSLPLRTFYLGRIEPRKGIDLIFKVLSEKNVEEKLVYVDFFGPVQEDYESTFLAKVSRFSETQYRGVLDFSNDPYAYQLLAGYDLFLFPTFYPGEGFPGAVLDSFFSGVPVLASDWNFNQEVIQDGKNGLIFPAKNQQAFSDTMQKILQNPSILVEMSKEAWLVAQDYRSEKVLQVLDNFLL